MKGAAGKLTSSAASRGLRPSGSIPDISKEVKDRIQTEISSSEADKKKMCSVCACCDELCKGPIEIQLNEIREERLKRRLKWIEEVPVLLRKQYDVPEVHYCFRTLSNVPLSPRGVIRDGKQHFPRLLICDMFFNSLKCKSLHEPPKFAIANSWDIGEAPLCFTEATWAEIRIISLSLVSGDIQDHRQGRVLTSQAQSTRS